MEGQLAEVTSVGAVWPDRPVNCSSANMWKLPATSMATYIFSELVPGMRRNLHYHREKKNESKKGLRGVWCVA